MLHSNVTCEIMIMTLEYMKCLTFKLCHRENTAAKQQQRSCQKTPHLG